MCHELDTVARAESWEKKLKKRWALGGNGRGDMGRLKIMYGKRSDVGGSGWETIKSAFHTGSACLRQQ